MVKNCIPSNILNYCLAIPLYDCVEGMGCIMSGYRTIVASSSTVLTSFGYDELGLDHPFASKDSGLARM